MISRLSRVGMTRGVFARREVFTRNFASSSIGNPYPVDSASFTVMEKCIDAAVKSGSSLSELNDPWFPVSFIHDSFLMFEQLLPFGGWPLAMVASAVLVRGIFLPIHVWSMKRGKEGSEDFKEMEKLNERMQEMFNSQNPKERKQMAVLNKKLSVLSHKHGWMGKLKGLVGPVLPLPLFITSILAARGIASHPLQYPTFALSDPLWLESLCLPDPYFVLPMISSAVVLTNLELTGALDSEGAGVQITEKKLKDDLKQWNVNDRVADIFSPEKRGMIKKIGFRGMVIGSLYVTTSFPSGCFFFLIPSTVLAFTQNYMLKQDSVKLALGLADNIYVPGTEASKELQIIPPQKTGDSMTVENAILMAKENSKLLEESRSLQRKRARPELMKPEIQPLEGVLTSFIAARPRVTRDVVC